MTAPTLVRRRLTINFERSVLSGTPQVMEVAIAPLSNPSAPNNDATLVGGPQSQNILLGNEKNPAYFDLVPTDASGLTDRMLYRVAWREKYMGKQFTQDFVMPDFDCAFDDLENLGNIIGGETYVQWADRLRPGGVAGLDQSGRVVDSTGEPITGAESAAIVQGNLDNEVVARQQGDAFLRTYFLQFADQQIQGVYQTTGNNLNSAVIALQNTDLIEQSARIAGDAVLHADITGLTNSTTDSVNHLISDISAIDEALTLKADLAVNGKLAPAQLPDEALTKAVPVANQTAMLALTAAQVQPGDFAVRPDGIFFLNTAPPSNVNNWVKFSVVSTVSSVNGQTGIVVLAAADVNARPAGVALPITDITGLQTALDGKAPISLVGTVTAIQNDSTIVKLVGGYIPHDLNDANMAYVNTSGQVTKKDGTVLSFGGGGTGGGGTGTVAISDVTGLQTVLDSKAGISDPRFTNSRTPTAHATSHATGGTDAITPAAIGARATSVLVPLTDVNGLNAILTNNGLTSTSDLDGLIATLTTKVNGLAITDVSGLNTALNGKVDTTTYTAALAAKADLSGGKVPLTQSNDYPITKVTGLQAALDNKIELVGGLVPLAQLPPYPTSKVTGLDAALGNMVALGSDGKLLPAQLPPEAIVATTKVANRGAMLLLTAQPGDICVIAATADAGSYVLQTNDPTVFANWVLLSGSGTGSITSVNGQTTPAVVLSASDVGARSSSVQVPMTEVANLTTTLGNKADTSAMTTALAAKASPADIEVKISEGAQNKPQVALAATSSLAALSGQQSIDGVTTPALGSFVLVTAQSNAVNNGLYQVASGVWPRMAEMATNNFFVKGTLVTCSGGGAHHDSLWQQTSASGHVGVDANTWAKVLTAGAPPAMTGSLGVAAFKTTVGGITTAVDYRAQVVTGGGVQAVAGGLQLDPGVAARKFSITAGATDPATGLVAFSTGSTVATVTHRLGTMDVSATFRDAAGNDVVLVGWKPATNNTITAEFDSVVTANSWRATVIG